MSNPRSLVKKTEALTPSIAPPPKAVSSWKRFLAAPPLWFLGLIVVIGLSLSYLPYYYSLHQLTSSISQILLHMKQGGARG